MKYSLFLLFVASTHILSAQDLQFHYDTRKFPSLYFQYLKNLDSGKAFIKPGAFLLKVQADMQGEANNIGQAYIQVSQSFRCWKAPIFLSVQYDGGLGLTEPKEYSYYITNTYSLGLAYSFQWRGAWLSTVLNYRVATYANPSHDPSFTLYWWRGFFHYKLELAGDFTIWTENKNHGDATTTGQQGKRFFFFAEPQLWYNVNKLFAVGTRTSLYYHVIKLTDNVLQAYPTLAVRFKL